MVAKARVAVLLCTPKLEIPVTGGIIFFHELYFKEVVLRLYLVGCRVTLPSERLQLKVW